ncbi:Cof subfamily protein (haloacid dehalogenase superfamily) [Solibacillus kalamii]|uniref:Predicted hydrolase of the HAD superfamily n=3 Tax=Solibacillus TaxID=648800 RepID=F2F2X8_SOLSS|nr:MULTISPECIES: Cof-type HAD-IIB family hydrolase [Solibacillus]AMO84440.1 phosphatase [Solibacillus silvestris]EKB47130.1 Phosphatase YidA [Solibacillus isronensis B3W22]MBM7664898.1 Cof subfamily protein (haloacid dehalogenase superfamily) [Solibacillus kalamii]OBW58765.1 phosphatase [Solibacillus silvestris]OUZ40731.1 HAD family phosphatase [Solibacillus kalamii]
MNEHLIVLDLDGTLLTDEKKISLLTKETLLKAKEAGHQVMIATGRPYRASQLYYQELSLTTPIVNFNGALIHHPKNPMWKAIHTTVDLSVVHDVVESVHKYEYDNLIAEVMDDVYLHREDEGVLQLLHMGNPNILTGDLKNTLKEDPTSLLIQADDVNTPIIRKHLQDVHAELIEHRRWGAPFPIIEIVHKGLSKAVGIDYIAKEMGIPRERIIAFGDEDNDLEMIDYAGVGVAMSNGIDDLKTIANEITLSNNEDGIAKFLQDRLKL